MAFALRRSSRWLASTKPSCPVPLIARGRGLASQAAIPQKPARTPTKLSRPAAKSSRKPSSEREPPLELSPDALEKWWSDLKLEVDWSYSRVLVRPYADIDQMGVRFLPFEWLRNHCRCEHCVDPATSQRNNNIFSRDRKYSMPPPKPNKYGLSASKDGLRIEWKDGHISLYPWEWLRFHITPELIYRHRYGTADRKSMDEGCWDSTIEDSPPTVQYDKVMADDGGVAEWTDKIYRYGFCFVDGVPATPEKTQELLERIAYIRPTFYGGFYDFTSDLSMKDTAYTNQALDVHTDTTYLNDPAGLQMFHILSHTDGEGGTSILVDGRRAWNLLLSRSPVAAQVLEEYPVAWNASGNDGIIMTPETRMPVFKRDRFHESECTEAPLLQIRWNPYDLGAVPLTAPMLHRDDKWKAAYWYDAAKLWNDILNSEENQYRPQLQPGRALIFDNWRVLHGRTAFTGKRRVCGGYINRDDFMSRWRTTNMTREKAMRHIV